MQSPWFNWLILPVFIYLSRTCDVTLATLRNLLLSKGIKKIVPVLGFFEVLIWLIAVTSIVKNLNNVLCYIAFAGGYSTGILIGITIEGRLALGKQVIRIITNQTTDSLIESMKQNNMGVTVVPGKGAMGPVEIIFTTVDRKDVPRVEDLIEQYAPNSFYTIEDARDVTRGVFPEKSSNKSFAFSKMILPGIFTNRP